MTDDASPDQRRWAAEADRLNRGRPRVRIDPRAMQGAMERGVRSVARRLRNAGLTIVGLFALLIATSLFTGGLGLLWLLAFPLVFMTAFIVLIWPSSRSRRERQMPEWSGSGGAIPLSAMAKQTETWLTGRAALLPRPAGPALERIVTRLRQMEPALAQTDPDSAAGGEAFRLLGQHLPGLVNAYVGLPRGAVTGEDARVVTESLNTVADEMDALCDRIGCERRIGFETETRFIETRYSERSGLSLDD